MKAVISVGGKFHAFYLAKELYQRNALERIITSYPKFEAVKSGIPRDKITSILTKEILDRGWRKLPFFIRKSFNPTLLISDIFDKLASRKIVPADIFAGWSSFSLNSLRRAKKMGMAAVLDHGSAHIKYHDKILKEERDAWNVPLGKMRMAHPGIVEKEIKEYEEADYVFIPSSFVKKTFLEAGIPEKKIIMVPYGVNLEEFKPGEKKDDVFRVVYAGGMTLQKGVHYLLQAFSELNLPNSELVLIGGTSEEIKPFFEKYEGKFKYIPPVPQSELAGHYAQSSVFVLNSIQDGFGMVIIQAMACGLPVIATENTGGPDIIENGKQGFVIPIRDVKALKEKLAYLRENQEEAEKMGESAMKKVSSGFSWGDYGSRMTEEYRKIIGKTEK